MNCFFAPLTDWGGVVIAVLLFVASSTLIIWSWRDIEYVCTEDHLLVRGGPFRSRIPYSEITRIFETGNIFSGYRILSSRDALEIQYKTGWLGSVTISPENKETFIEEMHKRCPQLG